MLDLEKLKELHETWQMGEEEASQNASDTLMEELPDIFTQLEKVREHYQTLYHLASGQSITLVNEDKSRTAISLIDAIKRETSAALKSFGIDTESVVKDGG